MLRALWQDAEAAHTGRFFPFERVRLKPAPVQPGGPPIWVGGRTDAAVRRTARYGTGWQGGGETIEDAIRVVAAIKQALPAAGRTIDEDHYGASFPFYFGAPGEPVVKRLE